MSTYYAITEEDVQVLRKIEDYLSEEEDEHREISEIEGNDADGQIYQEILALRWLIERLTGDNKISLDISSFLKGE